MSEKKNHSVPEPKVTPANILFWLTNSPNIFKESNKSSHETRKCLEFLLIEQD